MTNPLHQRSRPDTAWTTANAAENIPGVMTPLGATFWLDVNELGLRGSFAALGVLSEEEVRTTDPPDERLTTVFQGRFVVNVDVFRRVSDLTPGASGRQFEESLLGSVRDLPVAQLAPWRYALFATRAPAIVALLPGRTRRQTAEVGAWWRQITSEQGRSRPAEGRLREAYARGVQALRIQLLTTFVAQGLFDELGKIAERSGRPEAHLSLMTGYGDTEEVKMVSALHRLAHERISLDEFLGSYGARCPGENELSARSWREDPSPVESLARKYRDASGDPRSRRPAGRARAGAGERRATACWPGWPRPSGPERGCSSASGAPTSP